MNKQLNPTNIKNETININANYSLLKTQIGDNVVYGFKISTEDLTEEYKDFTDCLKNAEKVFDMLLEKNVLPLNLINVLDELVI